MNVYIEGLQQRGAERQGRRRLRVGYSIAIKSTHCSRMPYATSQQSSVFKFVAGNPWVTRDMLFPSPKRPINYLLLLFMSMRCDCVSELRPLTGSFSSPDMSVESHGGMILTEGNRRTRKKTYPSATLSTTNPT
jgi:hypothetical protein